MKTTKLFTFSLLITVSLISCSRGRILEPEKIGKQVFEMLKTISTYGKQDFIDNFLSVEEAIKISKKLGRLGNKTTSEAKEIRENNITKDYNKIKESGVSSGIVWQKIEYLDFVYEILEIEGFKAVSGNLYFKYDGETFGVEVSAVWNRNEYRISNISNLYQK